MIAESPLRVSARCTVVHRGGIVLSVAIHIKSKDLYTILFCRIGVVCGPTHPERCELVCAAHAHPIHKKKTHSIRSSNAHGIIHAKNPKGNTAAPSRPPPD